MKIVFLDVKTIGEDIDLSGYDRLGEVVKYPFSTPAQVPGRIADADVIVLNKVRIDAETIGEAPRLKLVCVTATGTNNLDKEQPQHRMEECQWILYGVRRTAYLFHAVLFTGKAAVLR